MSFNLGGTQPPVRVLRGATGPTGATGCPGMPGMRGAPGPQGATGSAGFVPAAAYCGLFNNCGGEVEIDADDVLALAFSDTMPAIGARYELHNCAILSKAGVYEIDYCLHGVGLGDGAVQLAVTHNGAIVPCTLAAAAFAEGEPFHLSGFGLAQLERDAHLHIVVYSRQGAAFRLADGVNIALRVRRM